MILEHLHLRHNAYLALDQTGQKLDQDSSILIWPQHFDTRCTVNIERDENLTSELIFGFAIADNIYSCPYFYVKFNSNDLETRHSELNELKHSGKRNTVQWQGYLLGIDTIVERETADEQCEMVVEFLEKSIEEIRNLLTSNKQEII